MRRGNRLIQTGVGEPPAGIRTLRRQEIRNQRLGGERIVLAVIVFLGGIAPRLLIVHETPEVFVLALTQVGQQLREPAHALIRPVWQSGPVGARTAVGGAAWELLLFL